MYMSTLVYLGILLPSAARVDIRSPGAEVTGSCELPCGCLKLNLDPLETQLVLLTVEPSLQLLSADLKVMCHQASYLSFLRASRAPGPHFDWVWCLAPGPRGTVGSTERDPVSHWDNKWRPYLWQVALESGFFAVYRHLNVFLASSLHHIFFPCHLKYLLFLPTVLFGSTEVL